MNMIAQILGLLAVSVIIAGYSFKDDKKLRLLNFAGVCLWLLHFLCLEAWSSVGALSISVLMLGASVAGLRILEKPLIGVNAVLVVSIAWSVLFQGLSWIELIPATGSFVMNIGIVLLSGIAMTRVVALGTSLWLAFGVLTMNPFVILANSLALASLAWRAWELPVPTIPKLNLARSPLR